MNDERAGNETEVRDSFSWQIFSKDGRDGVRCVYDKKSKWLQVERGGGSSTSQYAATLPKARKLARELASREFSMIQQRRFVTEVSRLVESQLR